MVELGEPAQAREPLLGLAVQPRVADGDGGGGGERLAILGLVRRPRPPRPRHARHDADRGAVDQQRNAEVRPDPLHLEPCAIPHARIVVDIRDLQRPARRQDVPGQALVALGVSADVTVRPRRARECGDAEAAFAALGQQDADEIRPHQLDGDRGEAVQHLPQVERRGEQARGLRETALRRAVVPARRHRSGALSRSDLRSPRVHRLALNARGSPPGASRR